MSTSELFVTVLFGVLDVRSGRFDYARAGHELPILLRANGSLVPIPSSTGMILGILPEIMIDEAGLQLDPGDLLLLFSDGATDASDPLDQRFGHDRLAQAMRTCPGGRAQAVCDCILSAILSYQGSASQFDDITLITICVDSPPLA
jgi:serine phosphatase RsbU (regulator of sigma subunit)